MSDKPTTRRPRGLTNGPRADRLMGDVLRLDQVWSDRTTADRWIVHQIHHAQRAVTIRRADKAHRVTLTYREMLAGYALVLDAGKRDRG
jgi:hypothetical protein